MTSPEVTWTGNDVTVTWTGSDVTVTWTGNDITVTWTGSNVTVTWSGNDVTGNGPEVCHCFPRFFDFSGYLGCNGTRAKPLYEGWISAHARAKARHFFPRFLVFREISGIFVNVRDVFGVLGVGAKPLYEG